MGLLNEVTQVISRQLNVNIRKLTIETEDGIFEGKIQLWVHDVEDVKTICKQSEKDSEYQTGEPCRRVNSIFKRELSQINATQREYELSAQICV